MIELTEEQRHILEREEESPPRVLDPASNTAYVLVRADVYERATRVADLLGLDPAYVLVRADVYERLHALLSEDDWTPDERLRLLAESGRRAGWDAPEMDDYDNYDESRKRLCP